MLMLEISMIRTYMRPVYNELLRQMPYPFFKLHLQNLIPKIIGDVVFKLLSRGQSREDCLAQAAVGLLQ